MTETFKSGVVHYDIQLETTEDIDPEAFGTKAVATFNTQTLHFVKLNGKENTSFQLVDLSTGVETNYRIFRNKKYAIETTADMIPSIGELVFSKEKKMITGYECYKAEAAMGDGKLVAWFTKDFGINFCPYVKAKGFALEYTLNMPYGKVKYTATKVKAQPINEALLQPSADYKKRTMAEIQAELTGQPQGTAFTAGEQMGDFELQDMAGKKVTLASLKGKVVLINFWFINCPPCRMEIPDLNKLKKEYAGKNVEFVAITFDEKRNVSSFLEKHPFDFQILADARGAIEEYGVMGFPTSVVIDKNGKIVNSKMGGSMNIKEELQGFIEVALGQ